jgi:hypothetical protein
MNAMLIYDILRRFAQSLENNMDYLNQLNKSNSVAKPIGNIIAMLEKGQKSLNNMNPTEVGVLMKFFGKQLANKNIPYANAYGRALVHAGSIIAKQAELGYAELVMIVREIIDEIRNEKGNRAQETISFWNGFVNTLEKGQQKGLILAQAVKLSLKENHWPLTRSDGELDEQVIFFCTRLAMTSILQTIE